MPIPRMSQNGLAFLKDCEGCELEVYADSGGALTIGVGHLLTVDERRSGKIQIEQSWVRTRDGLTEDQALRLLAQDLNTVEWGVGRVVAVPLCVHQRDALLSFAFNVGGEAFRLSTLLKRLNDRLYEEVPNQLRRWVWDNGNKVPGLINRREKEVELWLG